MEKSWGRNAENPRDHTLGWTELSLRLSSQRCLKSWPDPGHQGIRYGHKAGGTPQSSASTPPAPGASLLHPTSPLPSEFRGRPPTFCGAFSCPGPSKTGVGCAHMGRSDGASQGLGKQPVLPLGTSERGSAGPVTQRPARSEGAGCSWGSSSGISDLPQRSTRV